MVGINSEDYESRFVAEIKHYPSVSEKVWNQIIQENTQEYPLDKIPRQRKEGDKLVPHEADHSAEVFCLAYHKKKKKKGKSSNTAINPGFQT